MVSRTQRTPFAEWWWTVDKLSLAAIGALMLAGIVLSLAASPPVASRLGLDPFYFVNRHILFLVPTLIVLIGVSFLNPHQIRRLTLLVIQPDFGQTMLVVLVWSALFFMAGMRIVWVFGIAGGAAAGRAGAGD